MVRQIKLPSSYRAAGKLPQTWSVPPLLPHQKLPASNSLQQIAGSILVSSPSVRPVGVSTIPLGSSPFRVLEAVGDCGTPGPRDGWGDIDGAGGGSGDGNGGFDEHGSTYFKDLDGNYDGSGFGCLRGGVSGDGGWQNWGDDS